MEMTPWMAFFIGMVCLSDVLHPSHYWAKVLSLVAGFGYLYYGWRLKRKASLRKTLQGAP